VRITKEYDERRNEILDVSESLFYEKGYEKCTINDILKNVGIAKGTFYYYFKSKEEVLDAIVARYRELMVTRAEGVRKKAGVSPEEKLLLVIMAMNIKDKVSMDMLNKMHKTENVLLHQKVLNQTVTAMVPVLVKVIEEGMDKKVWNCSHPLQYMQIFLAATLTLTDDGIFQLDEESQYKVLVASVSLLEKMLDVPEDSLMQLFASNWK
jgi:AcrR family transcriptional regulator